MAATHRLQQHQLPQLHSTLPPQTSQEWNSYYNMAAPVLPLTTSVRVFISHDRDRQYCMQFVLLTPASPPPQGACHSTHPSYLLPYRPPLQYHPSLYTSHRKRQYCMQLLLIPLGPPPQCVYITHHSTHTPTACPHTTHHFNKTPPWPPQTERGSTAGN